MTLKPSTARSMVTVMCLTLDGTAANLCSGQNKPESDMVSLILLESRHITGYMGFETHSFVHVHKCCISQGCSTDVEGKWGECRFQPDRGDCLRQEALLQESGFMSLCQLF